VRVDRSRPGCAALVERKNDGVSTKPCLVVNLTHCCKATRRRDNIRMGRYSGCVINREPHPDPVAPANRRGRVCCLFSGTSKLPPGRRLRYFWDVVYQRDTLSDPAGERTPSSCDSGSVRIEYYF